MTHGFLLFLAAVDTSAVPAEDDEDEEEEDEEESAARRGPWPWLLPVAEGTGAAPLASEEDALSRKGCSRAWGALMRRLESYTNIRERRS
jgi:hypothetical protein